MDDLYAEYGQDINSALAELISIGYMGEDLYAIPANTTLGVEYGIMPRQDILDELGIIVDEDKVYTPEEIEKIFAAYKEKYGDGHYCLALFGTGADMYSTFYPLETLGGDGSYGVIMGAGLDGNTKIVNLFETDEYMDYCKMVRKWYEAGYINPDVTTITDDITSQLMTGNYFASAGANSPDSLTAMETNVGVEFPVDVYKRQVQWCDVK